MKRRVFALTLALSMVLLAACGPKGRITPPAISPLLLAAILT